MTSGGIHQTLHGYQDGHRLLAGSLRLAPTDRRAMLTLSDSPDVDLLAPDGSLLLGYPLPSREFYVLAKTWPATEVERPGCVWTHSLLLGVEALAVPDPEAYLPMFARPAGPDREPYESELPVPSSAGAVPTGHLPAVVETVLWTLYQAPLRPVDLRRQSLGKDDPQRFLLRVWAQQWPALRSGFSFAEAPRAARRRGKDLFDLQVTERPGKGSWEPGNAAPARTVVNPVSDPPRWCGELAGDMARPGDLREFLWTYGPGSSGERSSLSSLAAIWSALERGEGAAEVLRALARGFPDPSAALELKYTILATSATSGPREAELLLALAEEGVPESFAGLMLQLGKRASRLAKSDPDAARWLVRKLPRSAGAPARQVIEGVADSLTKARISEWAEKDPVALARLITRTEDLASRPAVWDSAPFEALWPAVGSPRTAKERRREMLAAMLTAHAERYVEAAFESWPDVEELYLDLLEAGRAEWHQAEFLRAASRSAVLRWLAERDSAPVVLAALLANWSPKQLARVPVGRWSGILEDSSELDDQALVRLFLAARDPAAGLGPVVAVGAYEALFARGGLGRSHAAKELLDAVPRDPKPDRSAKDAAAILLNLAFLEERWSPLALLEIEQPNALERVLAADGEGRVVRRLVGELGERELPQRQAATIFAVAMKTNDHKTLHRIIEAVRGFVPWL